MEQTYQDGRPSASLRMKATDAGIVLRSGEKNSAFDQLGARDVWVYQSEGTYFMHYDAAGEKGWLCALATSTDLVHWTKHGPVLELGEPGELDSASASYGVTYRDNNDWHMFYLGTPNVSPAPNFIPSFPYNTLKARSTSPRGPWSKQRDVCPFLPLEGTYYSATASPGHIIAHHGQYLQYFSASTVDKTQNAAWDGISVKEGKTFRTLGLAQTDNLDAGWMIEPEPLFPITEQIENSSLYLEKSTGTWFLFTNHVGIDNSGLEFTDAVWVYWSTDCTKWNPADKAIVLDAQNCPWSPNCIGLPSVVEYGGRLALFYDGPGGDSRSHMGRHIGLAWLDLPLQVPR